MITPDDFVGWLDDAGIGVFAGVPDSLLKEFGAHVMIELPPERHVITANEGSAVAVAIGSYLRTGRPGLVYLQNSGFGNAVNPILSLADPAVYGVPMVLLVGWRGQPGVPDEPQHVTQGRVMTSMIDGMDLPWARLPRSPLEAAEVVAEAVRTAVDEATPYVLLVEKDTFEPATRRPTPSDAATTTTTTTTTREAALAAVLEHIADDAAIVSTTGMLSRELFELRNATGESGDRDFLTVGGMGHASSIALGIALHEHDREVWCLDGDGALLMHTGALPVIADRAPSTFFHVVFNNGVHDSVGGQPTSIGVVDIPALARACGYSWAGRLSDLDDLDDLDGLIDEMRLARGPRLLELRVRPGARPDLGRPTRTPAESRRLFMAALETGP